jgi:hypothetical protein
VASYNHVQVVQVKIGFTGHRDKVADNSLIVSLLQKYPDSIWGHGGAKEGFDYQIDQFIIANRIPAVRFFPLQEVIRKVGYVKALLARDDELSDWCDFLVALYDGRKQGGTYHTISYADKLHKKVIYWTP